MRAANAPCSWGVLEFESTALAPGPAQVLDEIASTGYAGTELGDWGFLATDPQQLRRDLGGRALALVGAFVPVALSDAAAHDAGEALAIRTARLLRDTLDGSPHAADTAKIVLSDATAADRARTANAGRIRRSESLDAAGWDVLCRGADRIARAVRDATGLRTVFHHHCATFVEAPWEIDAVMQGTSADVIGLCLDTGHATYGGGNPLEILRRHRDRIWHVHFKDCSQEIADRARREGWDYIEAVRHGLFCELGRGAVDFAGIAAELRQSGYDGWIVVEQDVLPAMGTPAESAARNRAFLRQLAI
jgi:inosose dehydratase